MAHSGAARRGLWSSAAPSGQPPISPGLSSGLQGPTVWGPAGCWSKKLSDCTDQEAVTSTSDRRAAVGAHTTWSPGELSRMRTCPCFPCVRPGPPHLFCACPGNSAQGREGRTRAWGWGPGSTSSSPRRHDTEVRKLVRGSCLPARGSATPTGCCEARTSGGRAGGRASSLQDRGAKGRGGGPTRGEAAWHGCGSGWRWSLTEARGVARSAPAG